MKRMKNAWICAVLMAIVLLMSGCESFGQVGQAVGGWIQGEETNPGTQDGASEPGQNPENRPGETQDGTPGEETAVSEGLRRSRPPPRSPAEPTRRAAVSPSACTGSREQR